MIKIIDLHTRKIRELLACEATVLCLGNFDGVHLAHAKLVERVCALAKRLSESTNRQRKISPGAFFFEDHPCECLGAGKSSRLTSLEDKLDLFEALGLDIAIVADFGSLMNFTPEDFVTDVLFEKCGTIGAVCGYNFRFGKGGVGDAARLSLLFGSGCCEIVDQVVLDGRTVSSSEVRSALRHGDVERASVLLGRDYAVRAAVSSDGKDAILHFERGMTVPCDGRYLCALVCGEQESVLECTVSRVHGEPVGKILPLCTQGCNVKVIFKSKIRK